MHYEPVNTNQSDITTFNFGSTLFKWGKRTPTDSLLGNTKEFGLFVFNSAMEPATCRLIYEGDSYGFVTVTWREETHQQPPLPPDYLLLYMVKPDSSTSDHQLPILLGRARFPILESKELVEWTFWNGDTFGDVSEVTPVFSMDERGWPALVVVWNPQIGAYMAAYRYSLPLFSLLSTSLLSSSPPLPSLLDSPRLFCPEK